MNSLIKNIIIGLVCVIALLSFCNIDYKIKDKDCALRLTNIVLKNSYEDSIIELQRPLEILSNNNEWIIRGNSKIDKRERISISINKYDGTFLITGQCARKKNASADIVPNHSTAKNFATIIWNSNFGEDVMKQYLPYNVIGNDSTWDVIGSAVSKNYNYGDSITPKGEYFVTWGHGGIPFFSVDKRNGKILKMYRVR